jgi:uncharacterized protein YndB with AHSA1/START domain
VPPITDSIEINRRPEDVYAYSFDPNRRTEWQPTVQEIRIETGGPADAGTRARETRRVTGGPRTFGWEVTEHDPPHRWGFRGTDGPVRPRGTMTFSPANDGAATKVDFEIEFSGRGPAAILAALARRDARKQVPAELARLKERLELIPA